MELDNITIKPVSNVLSYLNELRSRMLVCVACFALFFAVAFCFSGRLYGIVLAPIMRAGFGGSFIYTGLAEAFLTKLHIVFFAALCCAIPIIFIQLYLFVAPALYKKERILLVTVLWSVWLLFIASFLFGLFFLLPWACKFLIGFQEQNGAAVIALLPRISEYIDFFISCMTGLGIAFQIPVALVVAMCLGFLQPSTLMRCRKIAIVLIFTIAAILTPPDIISQIALAVPMMGLYEIAILVGKKVQPKDRLCS